MGISQHMPIDEMGHNTQHLFDGTGDELEHIAVETVGCGPLIIMKQPDDITGIDSRDQHALFMRVRTLDGNDVELMFNISQVALLHEQTSEVMHAHMQQAFKILDAPQDLVDDYAKHMSSVNSAMAMRAKLAEAAELVMLVNEGGAGDVSALIGLIESPEQVASIFNALYGSSDDDDDGDEEA